MQIKYPLISIIIPTYNRAQIIGETLDSIIAQTYTNWECIVVDDGSTDNTEEVIAEYIAMDSRFQYHQRPEDRLPGGNAARNYGFEMSKGEYVQWFDSDDLMVPKKLELKLSKLINNCKADFCLSAFGYIDNSRRFVEPTSVVKTENLLEDIITKRIKINTLSPIYRKSFLEHKILFDETLLTAHELDFYVRIFDKVELDFCVCHEVLSFVRVNSSNSILKNVKKKYKSEVAKSNFLVRRRIHELTINKRMKEANAYTLSLYFNLILASIRVKDFEMALVELKYLAKHRYSEDLKFRVKFLKLIIITRVLQITDLKGYHFLKRYFA